MKKLLAAILATALTLWPFGSVKAQTNTSINGFTTTQLLLPNATLVGASFAVTAGDNVLYTVPAGRRALFSGAYIASNTGTTSTWYPEINISGTLYQINAGVSVTGSAVSYVGLSSSAGPIPVILEAGQSLEWHLAASGAGYIWTNVIEFSNTAPISQVFLTALATGVNTIYTVPSGKHAIFPSSSLLNQSGSSVISGNSIWIYNQTGSSIIGSVANIIPNGGSSTLFATVGTISSVTAGGAAPTGIGNATNDIPPFTLNSGDVFSITMGTLSGKAYLFGYVITY